MAAPKRQRHLLYGALASALLHALVALLVVRAVRNEQARPRPATSEQIQISLQEIHRPPPVKASPAPHVVEPPPAKHKVRADRARPHPARPGANAQAQAEHPASQPPAGSPTDKPVEPPAAPRWSEGWRHAEGLGDKPAQQRAPELSTTLDKPGVALGLPEQQPDELPRAEPIVPESPAVERARVASRVQGFAEAHKAYLRTEFPDVYWRNLKDELEKGFDVPYEVWDKGGKGAGVSGPRQIVAKMADQHLRDAADYAKTGNPYANGGPGAVRSLAADTASLGLEQRGVPGATMAQEMFMHQVSVASGDKLIARILVSQKDDGALADISLVGPSGNTVYDRLALKKAQLLFKTDLSLLGPLPPEGRRSLWAFETNFHVTPILPGFGCGLDAYFKPECKLPFQRDVASRVRLEAIY